MRQFIKTTSRVLMGLMVTASLLAPAFGLAVTTQPRDNDSNAILWGGAYSKSEFDSKLKNGDGHNSAANIQQIMLHENRGVTTANFDSADTVDGTVFKDGHVEVGGKTVATGAMTIGRHNEAGSTKSGSVYLRPTSASFVVSSIPAFVNMQGGTFHYAIIKSCGNWVQAKAVLKPTPSATPKPSPSKTPTPTPSPSHSPSPTPSPAMVQCVSLTPSRPDVANKPSTFRFTVTTSPANSSAITGYRFTFSDNTSENTVASQPFTDKVVTTGSLSAHAQVQTASGLTPLVDACSATVNITGTSPSPMSTPTGGGQVLGVSLPATGPEAALGGVTGLSAIGFASRYYLRSRKSLLSAMRRPKGFK